MRRIFIGMAGVLALAAGVRAAEVSKVWVADNGDGTYKNPVLHADYSDPDVIRIGDDFYMTASSFNAVPGLPILRSRGLVNWELISHVYAAQPPLEVYSKPQQAQGLMVFQRLGMDADQGVPEKQIGATPVVGEIFYLRVKVSAGGVCQFSYSSDGARFTPIGISFTAEPGRWIGAKVGLFALGTAPATEFGYADFDWFRVE